MKVLLADDEVTVFVTLRDALEEAGHEVLGATDTRSALEALEDRGQGVPEVVITDIRMPGGSGMDVLRRAVELDPERPVILMTGYATIEDAVDSMRLGAVDYIQKPFRNETILKRLETLSHVRDLESENESLRGQLDHGSGFADVIGESQVMRAVFERVRTVAGSDATVLIVGESGTGKERIARALHNLSGRHAEPFVAISCAALPETLLETELFGHEKGAFTGAIASRAGLFREADGGTLFLDEIGEVTTNIQVKLLRAIQEREVLPLGGRGPVPLDVRIIAATNQDLELGISEGWFREDLYYRLAVFPIRMPTLRQRRDDIEPLAAHFLKKGGYEGMRFAPEAMHRMMAYEWPGNVRQLENIVERSALMADGDVIEAGDLPSHVAGGAGLAGEGQSGGGSALFVLPDDGIHLESLEEDLIRQAIRKADGNKTRAAQLLGITRRTLYSRLDKMGWTANS